MCSKLFAINFGALNMLLLIDEVFSKFILLLQAFAVLGHNRNQSLQRCMSYRIMGGGGGIGVILVAGWWEEPREVHF
jgi:hypothetical protein